MNKFEKIFSLIINFGESEKRIPEVGKLLQSLHARLQNVLNVIREIGEATGLKEATVAMKIYDTAVKAAERSKRKYTATTAEENTRNQEAQKYVGALREKYGNLIFTQREIATLSRNYSVLQRAEKGSVEEMTAKVNILNVAWKKMSDTQRNSAAGKQVTADLRTMREEIRQLTMATGDNSRNIGNYVSGIYNAITSKIAVATTAIYTVKRVLQGVFQPFQDLEYRMSMVKAVSGATSEEFATLEQNARDLGASTEYTATEVAGLQLAYARMGFVPEQIIQITSATLDLATATGEDLAKSADVVGTTLRGFNLDASQTQRVVDVMTEAFNGSSLQLDSFYEAMKYVAPIASVANVSLEQTSAMLGVLADRGIRGSQAGTALRRIFTEMAKEGGSVTERLDLLSKTGLTLGSAMDEVGRYAMTALTVLSKSKDSVDGLTLALDNSAGAAKEAADIMRDNMKGDLDKFLSAVQEKLIAIGEFLSPLARGVMQMGTWVVTNLKTIITVSVAYIGIVKSLTIAKAAYNAVVKLAYGNTIAFGRAIVAEIGSVQGATTATKGLAAAKLLLASGLNKANTAVVGLGRAILANPWGLVLTVIASGIYALSSWKSKVDEVSKAFKDFTDELGREKTIATTLFDLLLKSSAGTQERAEAIRQINDKYGAYLPNLLSEKSTTEEIAAALQRVNEKLEENTRLKFKQQGIDAAAGILAEAEREALDSLLDDLGEKSSQEIAVFAAAYRDVVDQIKSGTSDMTTIGDFSRRFGLVGSEALHIFVNLKYAVGDYLKEIAKIDGLFGAGAQVKQGETPLPEDAIIDAPKDKCEWSLSKDKVHNDTLLKLKQQLHSGEISSEEQYQKQVLQLEIETLTKRIALNKDEAKTIIKLKNDLWDKQNQQKKIDQKEEEAYTSNRKAQEDKLLKYENDHIDAGIAAMKDGVEKKIKLNEQATKKAQESALKEYQTEVDRLNKELKANKDTPAKIAQIEAEKTALAKKYDQKTTDIKQAGTNTRVKIFKDASKEELEEYGKLPDKAAEVERQITENKRREVEKRLELSKKELVGADDKFIQNETIADATYGTDPKDKERHAARLENELELRQAKAQTYMADLAAMQEAEQTETAAYAQTIANIGRLKQESENLGNGLSADGTGGGFKGWLMRSFEITSDQVKQLKQQAYDLASQLGDAMIQAQQQASQRRLKNEKKAIDAQYKTESKLLDSKRDKGLISEKKYQEELEKLEAEKAAKEEAAERAAFEREKRLNIMQVIMNTAISIAKTFAQMGWLPGLPFAALAAASGAIQIATIASQKYAQGGLIPLGDGAGVVKGRSHAQGGHRIYLDGQPIGEIEGDELLAIVNKRDTARIGALSAANSVHGRKFATGGLITSGGYMVSSVSPPVSIGQIEASQRAELIKRQEAQQMATITAIREDTKQQIAAINSRIDRIKVVVLAQDMTDTQNDIKKIKVKSSW